MQELDDVDAAFAAFVFRDETLVFAQFVCQLLLGETRLCSRALTRYWVRRTCSAERKDFKVAGSVSGPVSVIPLCQYPNLGYAVHAWSR